MYPNGSCATKSMQNTAAADIEAMATNLFANRQITQEQRTFLMSVFRNGDVDGASELLINQIYDAIAAGKIRVVA